MSGTYVEQNGRPVEVEDVREWARWFETADCRVAQTTVGESDISTVFVGLDHSFGMGTPEVYETLVFGGPLDQEQERYATREEAVAGHEAMVARVRTYK
jgi:hypothetical protein